MRRRLLDNEVVIGIGILQQLIYAAFFDKLLNRLPERVHAGAIKHGRIVDPTLYPGGHLRQFAISIVFHLEYPHLLSLVRTVRRLGRFLKKLRPPSLLVDSLSHSSPLSAALGRIGPTYQYYDFLARSLRFRAEKVQVFSTRGCDQRPTRFGDQT